MRGDPWHPESVEKVVKHLEQSYRVEDPCNLPEPKRKIALYKPDVCAFDRTTGQLRIIVELETKHVRKSIMGATVLAQICAKDMNLKVKPKLIFILKNPEDEGAISKLKLRIDKMRDMLKVDYLEKPVEMQSREDFLSRQY